jgi:lysophospholipase L1-like esterase
MPALGIFNTPYAVQIPNLSTLFWWLDPFDYDRARNTSLTVGATVATGKVTNKAGSGGTATLPNTTGPTLLRSAGGYYSWSFPGTDRRLLFSLGSTISQPYLRLLIVRRTAAGSNCDFSDGDSSSHRSGFSENSSTPNGWLTMHGGTPLSSGGTNGAGTTPAKYNYIVGLFNTTTSKLSQNADANFVAGGNGYLAQGDAGNQPVAAFHLGATLAGANPLNGEIVGGFAWTSPYPTVGQLWELMCRLYQPGWPCTNLNRYQFLPQATIQGAVRGGDLVVFIGDSITAGTPGPQPWFNPLITLINAGVVTPITTSNKGTGGNTVVQMAARFATDVIAQSPGSCFLQGGINDQFGRTPMEDYLTALRSMSTAWTGSGRAANKLIMCGPMCRGEQFPPNDTTYDVSIRAYANAMNRVAVENGHAYVDFRQMHQLYVKANTTPPGSDSGILTSDSLHPNSTGWTQMSNAAFAKITLSN